MVGGQPMMRESVVQSHPEEEQTDLLDPRALERIRVTMGDDGAVADLVAAFLEDAPSMIEELRAAATSADAAGVRLHAHSLKGNAREFGATVLAEQCQRLEVAATAGNLENASSLVDGIEMEYARVRGALRARFPLPLP